MTMPKETREQKLERMFRNLVDTTYGMAYHHIGDGDGLTKAEAAEMVEFLKTPDQSDWLNKGANGRLVRRTAAT